MNTPENNFESSPQPISREEAKDAADRLRRAIGCAGVMIGLTRTHTDPESFGIAVTIVEGEKSNPPEFDTYDGVPVRNRHIDAIKPLDA